jgi:hypothetical protein
MRRLLQIVLALLVAWTIFAQPSMAQRRSNVQVLVNVGGGERVYYRAPRPYYYGFYSTSYRRPPGWYHGRKVGWGNHNCPPGLARRYAYSDYGYRVYERPRGRVVVYVPFR